MSRHADTRRRNTPRRVYLAATTPRRPWPEQADLTEPADLLDHAARGQAAELAVREHPGEHRDVPTVRGDTVHHADGRAWHVTVEARDLPHTRPTGGGAAPAQATELVATAVRQLAGVG